MQYRLLVMAICGLSFFSNLAAAQHKPFPRITFSQTDNGERQFEDLLDLLKDEAVSRLQRRIEEISSVCELSDKQEQKLEVAARGAAIQLAEQTRVYELPKLRRYQKIAGFEFDEEGNVLKWDEANKPRIHRVGYSMKRRSPILVERTELWNRSLQRVLNDQQQEMFAKADDARKIRFRDSAISMFVAKVGHRLRLTSDQKSQLQRAIADDDLGDSLSDRLVFQELAHDSRNLRDTEIYEFKFHHLVKEILDAEQMELWDAFYEPQLQALPKELARLKGLVSYVNPA